MLLPPQAHSALAGLGAGAVDCAVRGRNAHGRLALAGRKLAVLRNLGDAGAGHPHRVCGEHGCAVGQSHPERVAAIRAQPMSGPHSASHRFWGRLAALDMLCTAVSGWTFYWLAFVAR